MKKKYAIKSIEVLPLVLGLLFSSCVVSSHAQSAGAPSAEAMTRAQVKMERDDFLKSHTYDSANETWVVKKGYEPPSGMKSRAAIRAERDEFMRNNRYDAAEEVWVPISSPRDMSGLSREQVREETRQFVKSHMWDDVLGVWTERFPSKKKK